jgi:hypothetical protein
VALLGQSDEQGVIRRMSKTTRATQALEKAGVRFILHAYDYDPEAERIGRQARRSASNPFEC